VPSGGGRRIGEGGGRLGLASATCGGIRGIPNATRATGDGERARFRRVRFSGSGQRAYMHPEGHRIAVAQQKRLGGTVGRGRGG
jgi:hypothetical protein